MEAFYLLGMVFTSYVWFERKGQLVHQYKKILFIRDLRFNFKFNTLIDIENPGQIERLVNFPLQLLFTERLAAGQHSQEAWGPHTLMEQVENCSTKAALEILGTGWKVSHWQRNRQYKFWSPSKSWVASKWSLNHCLEFDPCFGIWSLAFSFSLVLCSTWTCNSLAVSPSWS